MPAGRGKKKKERALREELKLVQALTLPVCRKIDGSILSRET
jgi:hypothetical protein